MLAMSLRKHHKEVQQASVTTNTVPVTRGKQMLAMSLRKQHKEVQQASVAKVAKWLDCSV